MTHFFCCTVFPILAHWICCLHRYISWIKLAVYFEAENLAYQQWIVRTKKLHHNSIVYTWHSISDVFVCFDIYRDVHLVLEIVIFFVKWVEKYYIELCLYIMMKEKVFHAIVFDDEIIPSCLFFSTRFVIHITPDSRRLESG